MIFKTHQFDEHCKIWPPVSITIIKLWSWDRHYIRLETKKKRGWSSTLAAGLCEDLSMWSIGRQIEFLGNFIAQSTTYFFVLSLNLKSKNFFLNMSVLKILITILKGDSGWEFQKKSRIRKNETNLSSKRPPASVNIIHQTRLTMIAHIIFD